MNSLHHTTPENAMTLVQRLQAAQARQRAASARHDLAGVTAAKTSVAHIRHLVLMRNAKKGV